MEQPNINDEFFNGIYQDVWRKLVPAGLSVAECGFIEERAALQPPDAVLDLMCGYGRHALELARRGYAVTAVDNQPAYIAEIQQAATENNLPIKTRVDAALSVTVNGAFKAVLCMGNSFAFFAKDDAVALLKKVKGWLPPDGVFILSTWMIAEIAIRFFKEKEWVRVEEYKYVMEYKFHFSPSRIESEHTVVTPGGSAEVLHGVDYIFTLSELEAMFAAAGLTTKGVYGSLKGRLFRMGDTTAYIVAGHAPPG